MPDNALSLPLDQAIMDLQLSPQEQNLYQYHLNNLWSKGGFVHPHTGDISTLLQSVVEGPKTVLGSYYNIPTVWEGKQHSDKEAREHAEKVLGWHNLPAYSSPEAADTRYAKMHPYMEKDTLLYRDFSFIPVDHDPFSVVPVDHDPFSAQSEGNQ